MKISKKISTPILWFVLIAFFFNTVITEPAHAQVLNLPAPGQLVHLSSTFNLPMIRGLKVFKDAPFQFEFIVSGGEGSKQFLKEESKNLVKYFLTALTIPEEEMWVNLSPFERDRIVSKEFGITLMGKELLSQDYLLKQITASVMYPEGIVGKDFWKKIYQEAYKRFGTTTIPVNTFNKVWIVPDQSVIYENAADSTAVIMESKLKVMLEEDFLALKKSIQSSPEQNVPNQSKQLSNELIREIILPLLDKEVNEGKNFASLRQIYNSLILAFWYKNKLKQSLIGQGYVNLKKTGGVDIEDKQANQEIFKQYIQSYKKGVYNYIREDIGPNHEIIPRKYFSGGFTFADIKRKFSVVGADQAMNAAGMMKKFKNMFLLTVGIATLFGATVSTASALDNPESKVRSTPIVQVDKKQTNFENNADFLTKKISNLTGGKVKAKHQSIREMLNYNAILINEAPATLDGLMASLLDGTEMIAFDWNKIDELRKNEIKPRYRGLKHAFKYVRTQNLDGEASGPILDHLSGEISELTKGRALVQTVSVEELSEAGFLEVKVGDTVITDLKTDVQQAAADGPVEVTIKLKELRGVSKSLFKNKGSQIVWWLANNPLAGDDVLSGILIGKSSGTGIAVGSGSPPPDDLLKSALNNPVKGLVGTPPPQSKNVLSTPSVPGKSAPKSKVPTPDLPTLDLSDSPFAPSSAGGPPNPDDELFNTGTLDETQLREMRLTDLVAQKARLSQDLADVQAGLKKFQGKDYRTQIKRVDEVREQLSKSSWQLKQLMNQIAQEANKPAVKSKDSFLSIYGKVGTQAADQLSSLGTLGPLNLGIGLEGRAAPWVSGALDVKGFIGGASNPILAFRHLAGQAVIIAQQPTAFGLQEYGGVIVPDQHKDDYFGLQLLNINVLGYKEAEGLKFLMPSHEDRLRLFSFRTKGFVNLSVGTTKIAGHQRPYWDAKALFLTLDETRWQLIRTNAALDAQGNTVKPSKDSINLDWKSVEVNEWLNDAYNKMRGRTAISVKDLQREFRDGAGLFKWLVAHRYLENATSTSGLPVKMNAGVMAKLDKELPKEYREEAARLEKMLLKALNIRDKQQAVVVYGLRQQQAVREAVLNKDQNLQYWVERRGTTQIIIRKNAATGEDLRLSEAQMFYPKADKEKNGFETESFLRTNGGWMESGMMQLSGMADLERIAEKMQATSNYGYEEDKTGRITIYQNAESVPVTVWGSVPERNANNGYTTGKGSKMVKAPINPMTGGIVHSGLLPAKTELIFASQGAGTYQVDGRKIKVPDVMIRSFGKAGTVYLTKEQALTIPTQIVKAGETIKISFGRGIDDVVIGAGATVTYALPYATTRIINGKEIIIPAILESAHNAQDTTKENYAALLDTRSGKTSYVQKDPGAMKEVSYNSLFGNQSTTTTLGEKKVTLGQVLRHLDIKTDKKGVKEIIEELKEFSRRQGISPAETQDLRAQQNAELANNISTWLSAHAGLLGQTNQASLYLGVRIPEDRIDNHTLELFTQTIFNGTSVQPGIGLRFGPLLTIGQKPLTFIGKDGRVTGVPFRSSLNTINNLFPGSSGISGMQSTVDLTEEAKVWVLKDTPQTIVIPLYGALTNRQQVLEGWGAADGVLLKSEAELETFEPAKWFKGDKELVKDLLTTKDGEKKNGENSYVRVVTDKEGNPRLQVLDPGRKAFEYWEKKTKADLRVLKEGGQMYAVGTLQDGEVKISGEKAFTEDDIVKAMEEGRIQYLNLGGEKKTGVVLDKPATKSQLPSRLSADQAMSVWNNRGALQNIKLLLASTLAISFLSTTPLEAQNPDRPQTRPTVSGNVEKKPRTVAAFLTGHYLVVWKNGTSEFISEAELNNPVNKDALLKAKEIQLLDKKGEASAYVYLNSRRIQVKTAKGYEIKQMPWGQNFDSQNGGYVVSRVINDGLMKVVVNGQEQTLFKRTTEHLDWDSNVYKTFEEFFIPGTEKRVIRQVALEDGGFYREVSYYDYEEGNTVGKLAALNNKPVHAKSYFVDRNNVEKQLGFAKTVEYDAQNDVILIEVTNLTQMKEVYHFTDKNKPTLQGEVWRELHDAGTYHGADQPLVRFEGHLGVDGQFVIERAIAHGSSALEGIDRTPLYQGTSTVYQDGIDTGIVYKDSYATAIAKSKQEAEVLAAEFSALTKGTVTLPVKPGWKRVLLQSKLNHTVTQEWRDQFDVVHAVLIGNKEDGVFTTRLVTRKYYKDSESYATRVTSSEDTYVAGTGKLWSHGETIKKENGFVYAKMYTSLEHQQGIYHIQKLDARGRLIALDSYRTIRGEGVLLSSKHMTYRGVLGSIDTSDGTEAFADGINYESSLVVYGDGSYIPDVFTADLTKVFVDNKMLIERRMHFELNGRPYNMEIRENRDGFGRVLQEIGGRYENGQWLSEGEVTIHYFYKSTTAEDVVDATASTYVNKEGKTVLFAVGQKRGVDWQRGLIQAHITYGEMDQPLEDGSYEDLKIKTENGFIFDHVYRGTVEYRDGMGRLIQGESEHKVVNVGDPGVVMFRSYGDQNVPLTSIQKIMSVLNISNGAYIHSFNGHHNLADYEKLDAQGYPLREPNLKIEPVGLNSQRNLLSRLLPQTLTDIPNISELPTYEETRWWGGAAVRVYGRTDALEQTVARVLPTYSKTYFNHTGRPLYNVQLRYSEYRNFQERRTVDPTLETPHNVFVTQYSDVPGHVTIFEADIQQGVVGQAAQAWSTLSGVGSRFYVNGRLGGIDNNRWIHRTMDGSIPNGMPQSAGLNDALRNGIVVNGARAIGLLDDTHPKIDQARVDKEKETLPKFQETSNKKGLGIFFGVLGTAILGILNAFGVTKLTNWLGLRYFKSLIKKAKREFTERKWDPTATLANRKAMVLAVLNDLGDAKDIDAVIAAAKRHDDQIAFREDVAEALESLFKTNLHLSLPGFKAVVEDAKTLANEGKLQVNNLDTYLIRRSVEAAVLKHVNPQMDDMKFYDRTEVLEGAVDLQAQLDSAKPNFAALMPNMGGVFTSLMADATLKAAAQNTINDLVELQKTQAEPLEADDILAVSAKHLDRNHKAWYEFVNAISEPLGGHTLLHSLTTFEGFLTKSARVTNERVIRPMENPTAQITIRTKRDLIVREIVNRYMETRGKKTVETLGDKGPFIKHRHIGGWVDVPLNEYVTTRMVQNRMTVIRPTLVQYLVKGVMNGTMTWDTVREADKFWRSTIQVVYNNMVATANRVVQNRSFFLPDDMDRLFHEGIDIRKDLGISVTSVREALEGVMARQIPYFVELARSRGVSDADIEKAREVLTKIYEEALVLLGTAETSDEGELYGKINGVMAVLAKAGGVYGGLVDAAGKKVFVLGGAPWSATDRLFLPETVFMQECIDRFLMPQKKLDFNQSKLPLASYPSKLLESLKVKVLGDKRFWMVPGQLSWYQALKAIFVDPDYFKQSADALGLNSEEKEKMVEGLNTMSKIIRNTIVYSSGLMFVAAAWTLPKLLMMLGAVTMGTAALPVTAGLFMAALFGGLSFSTFYYLRVARVAKDVADGQNMYAVRTKADLFIALKQVTGAPMTLGDRVELFLKPVLACVGSIGLPLVAGSLGLLSMPVAIFSAVTLGVPAIIILLTRMIQTIRLKNMFTYDNFGNRRDIALNVYRDTLEQFHSRVQYDIDDEQFKALSDGTITYQGVKDLTHEIDHSLKRLANKFYREDMPSVAAGHISPFSRFSDIPRLMLYGTYAAQFDLDWKTARQAVASFINNTVILNQFRNFLSQEFQATEKETDGILGIIFRGMSQQRLGVEEVNAQLSEWTSRLQTASKPQLLAALLVFDEEKIEDIIKLFPQDISDRLKEVQKAFIYFISVRENTMVNINEKNRRVFQVFNNYAKEYKWDDLYQSIMAKPEVDRSPEEVAYVVQAESNYRELAADKFIYLFQPVNMWTASNPELHKEMAERWKDLPNVGVIEPLGYSLIIPIKDAAWMVQHTLQAQSNHVMGQDVSNRLRIEEAHFLPSVLSAYDANPRLAGQIFPLWSEHQLTTLASGSGGHAEGTWSHPVQSATDEMGTTDVYGKWLFNTDSWYGNFLPSLVIRSARLRDPYKKAGVDNLSGRRGTGPLVRPAEDALQGGGVTAEGFEIKHVESVEVIQDKTHVRKAHQLPELKYSGDIGNLFKDEEPTRQFLSPGETNKKATKVGLMHFFLRALPSLVATVTFIVCMAFKIDAWYGLVLPYVASAMSFLFMHAITIPATVWYDQLYGRVDGMLTLLKRMFIKPGFAGFQGSVEPTYIVGAAYDLTQGKAKFPPTDRTGWFLFKLYNEVIKDNIMADYRGIVIAAPLAILIGFFVNFHPITMLVSMFYFNMVLGWLFYPQVYNPGVASFMSSAYERVRYQQNIFAKAAWFAISTVDTGLFFGYSTAVGLVANLFGGPKADQFMDAMSKTGHIFKKPGEAFSAWGKFFTPGWKGLFSGRTFRNTTFAAATALLWVNVPAAVAVACSSFVIKGVVGLVKEMRVRSEYREVEAGVNQLVAANQYRVFADGQTPSIEILAKEMGLKNTEIFRLALSRYMGEHGLSKGLIAELNVITKESKDTLGSDYEYNGVYKFVPEKGRVNQVYPYEPSILPGFMRSKAFVPTVVTAALGYVAAYAWSVKFYLLGQAGIGLTIFHGLSYLTLVPAAIYLGIIAIRTVLKIKNKFFKPGQYEFFKPVDQKVIDEANQRANVSSVLPAAPIKKSNKFKNRLFLGLGIAATAALATWGTLRNSEDGNKPVKNQKPIPQQTTLPNFPVKTAQVIQPVPNKPVEELKAQLPVKATQQEPKVKSTLSIARAEAARFTNAFSTQASFLNPSVAEQANQLSMYDASVARLVDPQGESTLSQFDDLSGWVNIKGEKPLETSKMTGAIVWHGKAALVDGNKVAVNKALDYLRSVQDADGGFFMTKEGPFAEAKSTENVWSALAFLSNALKADPGNENIKEMIRKGWGYGKIRYNKELHYFARGGSSDWDLVADTTTWIPLDLIMNDPPTEDLFGVTKKERLEEVERMLNTVEQRLGIWVNGRLVGVSFSEYSKKKGAISIEWSSQLALLYLKTAKYYEVLGNTEKKNEFYDKYLQMVQSLRSLFHQDANGHWVAPYAVGIDGSVKVLNVYEGGWVTSDAPASMISSYYFRAALEGFDPLTGEKIVLKETPKDKAMGASAALSEKNLGGIDLSKVTLRVQRAEEGGIQLNFNDPAMLQLLLSADGLTPLIYDVNPMTPAMIDRFVGIK